MHEQDYFVHIVSDGETRLFIRAASRVEAERAVMDFAGADSYADALDACGDADFDVFLLTQPHGGQ